MSCGRRPELIAAILAWFLFYNTFIHTPPKSFLTKRCGTFWEPNPEIIFDSVRTALATKHVQLTSPIKETGI